MLKKQTMRKHILPIVIISTSLFITVKAQVGINTATPTSTLDVAAKNPTGGSTNVDGLLIPRVDRNRAQNMTGIPVSTLVYINDSTSGTANGAAININATGYYYFDGTVWIKLNPTTAPAWNLAH
jgi:hypothetical protein